MSTVDEITKRSQEFAALVIAGDAAGIANKWAEDGKMLAPGRPAIEGRDAVRAFWEQRIADGIQRYDLTTVDVEDFGDVAVEHIAVSMSATVNSQNIDRVGKGLVVYKRNSDGGWLTHRVAYNADA